MQMAPHAIRLVALLLPLSGCLVPEPADIDGTIVSMNTRSFDVPGGAPIVERSMFVVGGPHCGDNATLWYDHSTAISKIAHSISVPADTSALVVGAHVMVWTSSFRETSCPPRTGALRILVLP